MIGITNQTSESNSDEFKLTSDINPVIPEEKESSNMDWIVPILGGLAGAALVVGVVLYSIKKEEEYGLIGSPRIKQIKQASEPSSKISSKIMPSEVKQVVREMEDNAEKAQEPANSVFVSHNVENGDHVWVIGDNYERIALNLVYKNDIWYYRYSNSDERDREMPGGFKEAMANAKTFYTG